ncbi:restriction endonuclease subunit S [Holzapfeliella floricola]|uniref:restriction endonuclease subunit S n=1 Tax=Holzapfeliella floricola TaxID=679249 RepID=UPI0007832BF6|nr:restriction endonuclease subunit S [Holzapfeliella floricola]
MPFFDRSSEIKYLNTFDFDEEVIVYPGEGSKFYPRYFKGKYSLHQRAYGLYNFKDINPLYLLAVLQTKSNVFLRFSVGTTAKSLRRETFSHVDIPTPSREEQDKIANLVTLAGQELELYKKKRSSIVNLKNAYLQKLFC